MLVCGCINPPPEKDPNYAGIYFRESDDLPAKAKALAGTPLRVEHHDGSEVGKILTAWTAPSGALFALAEINTADASGAVAANYVKSGKFRGFSLGYRSQMSKCCASGRITVGQKYIQELSICKEGARPGCTIERAEAPPPPAKRPRVGGG